MPFNIHSIYDLVFKIWRRKRFNLFLEYLKPQKSDILLDVGGYPWFWLSHPQPVAQIDVLNIHKIDWDASQHPNYNIKTIIGDGCSLNLPDKSYDIGFSNSVIEHVGSWEKQKRFAAEIRRVANAIWVQTPAFECPIEPHYIAPCIHYFPPNVQKKIIRWTSVWGWLERPDKNKINEMVENTRLLRKSEMIELFPDCKIITEKLFGLIPKSYIAVRLKQ